MEDLDLRETQRERHVSDVSSGDVMSPSPARLKSRALEMAALVGRILSVKGDANARDVADSVLSTACGAANLMRIDLRALDLSPASTSDSLVIADAAGRLADAAEKLDHLEDMNALAKSAIVDAVRWALAARSDVPAA